MATPEEAAAAAAAAAAAKAAADQAAAAEAKRRKDNEDTLRYEFGWASQIVDGNKNLKDLFDKAIKEGWSVDRFNARLKVTRWYKNTTENARKMYILKRQDPATYKRVVDQKRQTIQMLMGVVGAVLPAKELERITTIAVTAGLAESEIAAMAKGFINYAKNTAPGSLIGRAGEAEDKLRGLAAANGVAVSDQWVLNAARKYAISNKEDSSALDSAMDWIQQQAVNAYPSLAEQLKQREPNGTMTTVDQLASNYKQSMAKILELNDKTISLSDPTLRKALQGTPDPTTGKLSSVPLWQFEKSLRNDSRWAYTNGAKKEVNGFAETVLKDFGFLGGGRSGA